MENINPRQSEPDHKRQELPARLKGFLRGINGLNSLEQIPYFVSLFGRLPSCSSDFKALAYNLRELYRRHQEYLRNPDEFNVNPLRDFWPRGY